MPISQALKHVCLLAAALSQVSSGRAADPFAEFIRSTPARTPEEERQGFHVPPGFEVQLFASEPMIGKPMNMAFDGKGRLWLTQSREYPFPVKPGVKGRDEVRILEDTDGDGHADKVTTFANGLNIPIGLYPYKNGVISLSLPNISFYQDTDHNGMSDKIDQVLGPVGYDRDTHGLVASFRRGFDGWIYATHGFNNNTTLHGKDGSTITMSSGNTWRFRPDGSTVEQWTHGQVNPFGLMFDPRGNLYSADCHSSPIYQLLHGAHYPSFGKPDDGLGFAPTMMHHSHGSTAIGGIVYYAADTFPKEFRDNMFVGNVMTCRINRDTLEQHGSTLIAKEAPDFLSSDDPWFRPVDIQLGPDGAIYVADFYNRIIGHYEVPLNHPGRDHEMGRIWRIAYKDSPRHKQLDLTKAPLKALIAELGAPNHTRRLLALDQLSDRIGEQALPALRSMLSTSKIPEQKAYGLWLLHRLGKAQPADYTKLVRDPSPLVRLHAVLAAAELPSQHHQPAELILPALKDKDAFVQRAAAYGAARVVDGSSIRPLLELRRSVPADDTHLIHVARMALRDAAQQPLPAQRTVLDALREQDLSEADSRALADVAAGITNVSAGAFLLEHLRKFSEPRESMTRYLKHAVRYLPSQELDTLAKLVRTQFDNDLETQFSLFKSIQDGMNQRGAKLTPGARQWGADLAVRLLASVENVTNSWINLPVEGLKRSDNPWTTQKRVSADGNQSLFLCSLPKGEGLTGKLRSESFVIPEKLRFYIAGHDGFPDKPAQNKNKIQLRLLDTDEIIATANPPRNDTAQSVTWDLKGLHKSEAVGSKGVIEVIDADEGTAYAWLAVGRFSPLVVSVPTGEPGFIARRQSDAADLARTVPAPQLEVGLKKLLLAPATANEAKLASARALLVFHPNDQLGAVVETLGDPVTPPTLRDSICQAVAGNASPDLLKQAMKTLPGRLQLKLAQSLAGSPSGAEALIQLVSEGQAPAGLLRERTVKEKLLVAKPENGKRIDELTRSLAPVNEQVQKLIEKRRAGFSSTKFAPAKGEQLFTQNCRTCHQLDGQGGLVGPQLDGIGNRGLERLCEDVLDPNRSVDQAFRVTLVVLNDGDVVSGLFRREEGETIVLADATGKEVSVPKKKIQERKQSESSLMPDNFGEILTSDDFNSVMAFLLSKGTKGSARK
ncbi:MAG TPA: PVC-type heme-binding CxxCH protein [Candidatus Saccharimonadales bacterium]|nr:PVC-type heme-binding CxxCH protein [Candidatus Saccharimonadales bacterium]